MNRKTAERVKKELEQAIAPVLAKHGLWLEHEDDEPSEDVLPVRVGIGPFWLTWRIRHIPSPPALRYANSQDKAQVD